MGETRVGGGGVQACSLMALRTSDTADAPKWAKLAREATEFGHAGKWLRRRRIRRMIPNGR